MTFTSSEIRRITSIISLASILFIKSEIQFRVPRDLGVILNHGVTSRIERKENETVNLERDKTLRSL